jgi:hypothetical protein|tara:strand:+ start:722 stop:1618 length:897 start_codon:yes stop_codon:yes gene_type:complete
MNETTYKSVWENCEKTMPLPTRARKIVTTNFEEFKIKVLEEKKDFVEETVNSLYSGDLYILKGAFTKEFMTNLRKNTFLHYKNKPSEFHKMTEGSPDFHRKIDLNIGKKYSFKGCKHSFYFYSWNEDPLNLFKPIYEEWRVIKKLMGLKPTEYENNTPKDGVIDRIQVVQYPSKIGYLEPHSDPYKHQRLIHSGYMSKKGVDFEGLGFYLIGENDKIIEVEDLIDVGDVGIAYASVYHGVAPVNTNKEPNWNDINDGRWFLSMYSNESNEVKSRHTGYGVLDKINIKSNLKAQLYPKI